MMRFRAALVFLLAAGLTACSGHAGGQGVSPNGVLPQQNTGPISRVRPLDTLGGGSMLTMAMGDSVPQLAGKTLSHLYLGIWRIDVTSNGQTGTIASYTSPNVIDVLAYQGQNAAPVGSSNVATQTYTSSTFVVDIPSSVAVFTDGTTMPLGFLTNTATKSSAGAGSLTSTVADGPNAVDIISNHSFSVPSGSAQSVRVDFNAFESLAMPYGSLVTRPVLYLAPMTNDGDIQGTVVNKWGGPVSGATVVAKDANGNIGNTTQTDAHGNFDLTTLNTGSYNLTVYNYYTNAAGQQYQASGQSNSGWTGVYGPTVNVTGGTANAGNIAD
jgi:hypothetical protein